MAESPEQSSADATSSPVMSYWPLALLISDAIDELDAAAGQTFAHDDLAGALLYGWATGVASARELAIRNGPLDTGLQYLLGGQPVTFQEIRSFRETRAAELEALYASILEVVTMA